jgi:small conductance mechanosensitive channel
MFLALGQIPGQSVQGEDSVALGDSVTDALSTLGEGVTSAGRLLLQGEWSALGTRIVDGTLHMGAELAPRILSALFVAVFFYSLYRVFMSLASRFMERSPRVNPGMQAIGVKTLRVLGIGFIGVVTLSQLGVNVSAILAGFGIAGLAVGFAAKDSLGNFISGITILLDRPFHVGDWVEVGDIYGQVKELTLRSTRIQTPNREIVVIPNDQMVNQALWNRSAKGAYRLDVEFGVAYKEDIDQTRDVVLGLVEGDDRLASNPGPTVAVTRLNDSSVDFQLRLWLLDAGLSLPVRWEYTEKIRKALAEADIEIPFPHLQLFVDEAKGLAALPLFRDRDGEGEDGQDGGGKEDDEEEG